MSTEKNYSYEEMNAIITMCLAENSKALQVTKDEAHRSHIIIRWLIIGWMITVVAFLTYLACFDINLVNYGDVTDSKINAGAGHQAETMTINNNLGGESDESKK